MMNETRIHIYPSKALPFLFCLVGIVAGAQRLEITYVELVEGKIVVHYDLEDNNPSHEYAISIFSSKDNYAAPLTKVTGDVGNEVKPGLNKAITWDAVREVGQFYGQMDFQVKGKVFIPFMKLTDFDVTRKYKRGRSYPVLWSSGNMSGQIDIELYDGKTRVASDRNVPNTGKFEWFIPGHVKSSRDYHIKFTNTKNRDDSIESASFRIVPRIPALVKGLAIAAFGGMVAVLSSAGGGGTEGEPNLPLPKLPQ